MKVEDRFVNHLTDVCGVGPEAHVLLAVSGGLDSMAMLFLFLSTGYHISVGHINHGLRAEESEHDAFFVKKTCEDHNIPFYSANIPQKLWKKGNLQDVARNFRYEKLHEWKSKIQAAFIATAHHLDDSLETSLMFFMRGTGINGLTGIAAKDGCIIRPLSIFSRKDLEDFAKTNQISFREDSSNLTDKYTRNYLRNQILPAFDHIDKKNRQGFYHSLANIRKSQALLNLLTLKFCADFVNYEKDYIRMDGNGFKNFSHPNLLLYQFLSEYSFQEVQINLILQNNTEGKVFMSKTHILTIQQNYWTLREKGDEKANLTTDYYEFSSPGKYYIEENLWDVFFVSLPVENKWFGINRESVEFPVTIRPWSTRDVFRPVQMKGQKKSIKKLLSEQKIPIESRKNKLVLVDSKGLVLGLEGGFFDVEKSTNLPGREVLTIHKNGNKIF